MVEKKRGFYGESGDISRWEMEGTGIWLEWRSGVA